jgi:hypothetical protein
MTRYALVLSTDSLVFEAHAMPLTRATLIAIKSSLISARSVVQDSAARAKRSGDVSLAERLRDIAERLADELDYVDRLLGVQ